MGHGLPSAARGVAPRPSTVPFRAAEPKLATEMAVRYAGLETKLTRLEDIVEQHDRQLRAVPSSQQIQAAIERAFDRSATALDHRFSEQARSIESLKTMVGQTDELLEKVLESIYSLSETAADRDRTTAQITH